MSAEQGVKKGNDRKSFITALVANTAALAIQVGAFTILKSRLQRIYSPRSYLPPPEKRAEALPGGPWKWLPTLLTSPSKDIIKKNGLDAYMFIRFLRMLLLIFAVFTVFTWPILLPVVTVNIHSQGDRDGLSRLSWGNVPPTQQTRYVAHLVVVYGLTFFVLWLIRYEVDNFVKLRHQFLISQSHSKLAQAKTVLITSLPDEVSNEKDLRRLLSFVPGGINKIWIYRDNGELPVLHQRRLELCKQLEKAECVLLRAAIKAHEAEKSVAIAEEKRQRKAAKANGEEINRGSHILSKPQALDRDLERDPGIAFDKVVRPTHRLGKIPLIGQKVDTITWCKDEILRLTAEINTARQTIDQNPSHGSVFVQCNLQMGAQVLAQVVTYHQPLAMYKKWSDVAPEDVIWANIDDGAYETRFRYVTSWLATIGLIVLWSFPVAFVGLLSNVDSLCSRVSWLAWVCRLPSIVQGILQGLLPPVFLAILFLILPILLRGLAWYECIPRYSLLSISVYKRYFAFLVIHGFLIVTLSSGLTAAIPQILNNPGSIVEQLATRLPDAAIFFLTYTVTTGLAGAASALLQLIPLIRYFIRRFLFGTTPRQVYEGTFMMPKTDFGTVLPRVSLVAAIALAYSVIAPVINGLAFLSFGLLWLAWKFLFTWVLDQPDAAETGGLYFPLAISNLYAGLYIEQLCLIGLFFLATDASGRRSALPQGILMVVLLIITVASHILLHHSYDPIIDHLPMSFSTKKLADRYERQNKGSDDIFPDLFNRENVRSVVRKQLKIKTKVNVGKEDRDKPKKISSPVALKSSSTAITSNSNGGPSGLRGQSSRATHGLYDSEMLRRVTAAPAAAVINNRQDDDSEDEDNEEHAFDHPSTYVEAPWVWIPKDKLGLSTFLVDELRQSQVEASDEGALIDEKGNVDVSRNPPDEEWSGGHDT